MDPAASGPDGAAAGSGAALDPPVRAQLMTLASDVLGRLPADEVPAALRPIARFTPAKRQRLGATALAAALDNDDAFRAAVARTVSESSPALAEAVREGRSTAAADPVDVALVAYLLRPAGWADAVAEAQHRLARERAGAAGGRDELAAARRELADARARARGEEARTREAVAAAVGDAQREIEQLRRTVRERTRELRAAERERDAAAAQADDLAGRLDGQAAAHQAELRRHRARLADLERAAESARRGARQDRDVDDARLWLLVDTLVQAANGVRRELSLPAPAARPADAVGAGSPDSRGARTAGDAAALDRLLALPDVHLIVDGYNVTKTGYPELALADQRTRLAGALAPLGAQSGAEVTVVFDGAQRPPAQPAVPRGVRVLFSAADEIADDLIRRLVDAEPAGRVLVVVTSDQQVVRDTTRAGAWTAPSAVLLARLGAGPAKTVGGSA